MPKVSGKLVLKVFTQIAESHSDITITLTMKLPVYLLALAWSSPCNRVYPTSTAATTTVWPSKGYLQPVVSNLALGDYVTMRHEI